MVKGIIFDFDGTLVDSIDVKTNAFAEIYEPYGQLIVEKVIKYHIKNGGISRFDKFEYFHNKYLKKQIDSNQILALSDKFSNIVIDKVVDSPFFPGVLEFISNRSNFKKFISTATPQVEIVKILKREKIFNFFDFVQGSPASKSEHIQQIMKKYKYNSKEIIYVGDTKSDYMAALKNEVLFVSVKDKFDDDTIVLKNFNEITQIVKKLNKKN